MSTQSISRWIGKLGRKKNLDDLKSMNTPLNRCLTTPHLILFAVAQMAGAGVYTMTGMLIRDQAGPAGCISFLIGAISALFTGVCYAEFASVIPRAGSCYIYTYAMFGEFLAFIVGWTMISDSIIALSSIAKAFSGTVDALSNGAITNWTMKYVGSMNDRFDILDTTPDLVALALIICLAIITIIGAKISITFNGILTTIQIICLLIISAACFGYGDIFNWTGNGGFFPHGFTGVIEGASIVVFAFSGFEGLANASEETINPRKSIPTALFTSLFMVTVLYVLASLGLSYVVPRDHILYASPFVAAFTEVNAKAFVWVAGVGTVLATGASKIVYMFIIPRLIYAMARDGLLFKFLGRVDSRTQVPIFALMIGTVICGILAVLLKIQLLVDMTSMGILISFLMIGMNLIVLRYLHWEEKDTESSNEMKKCNEPPTLVFRDIVEPLSDRLHLLRRRAAFKGILVAHLISDLCFALIVDHAIVTSKGWAWFLLVISFICLVLTFLILCLYRPIDHEDSFETPLMPVAPVITILVNMILILRIPYMTWIRFLIWTLIGMLIYLFYGIHNSNVDEASTKTSSSYLPLEEEKSHSTYGGIDNTAHETSATDTPAKTLQLIPVESKDD